MEQKKRQLAFLLALLGVSAFFISGCGGEKDGGFRTADISRGNLFVAISATGTVEPEEVIDVGAQIAGQILAFGKDKSGKPVDYGSEIEAGSVLAQIDESLYQSDVALAEAQLARAKADQQQSTAKLFQAERDWKRAEDLGPSEALSKSSHDSYRAGYETAKAAVAVADAGVLQADATLAKAKRNLGYCIIKSPVNGVIIDRRVNIGQTVVSSLNAPSLFLIAKDLRHMQVWVSVNEADIGNIHQGQKVTFSVDALPGQTFSGEVTKVRLNATMVQNVVTYIVEVLTDNSSGKLLPYLTANVTFEVSNTENVLLAPNAALRWSPKIEGDAATPNNQPKPAAEHSSATSGTVYALEAGKPRMIRVTVGGSDGARTEVRGNELKEGMQLIIGEEISAEQNARPAATNPFAPPVMRGRRDR